MRASSSRANAAPPTSGGTDSARAGLSFVVPDSSELIGLSETAATLRGGAGLFKESRPSSRHRNFAGRPSPRNLRQASSRRTNDDAFRGGEDAEIRSALARGARPPHVPQRSPGGGPLLFISPSLLAPTRARARTSGPARPGTPICSRAIPGVETFSILTVGDSVHGYRMVGFRTDWAPSRAATASSLS